MLHKIHLNASSLNHAVFFKYIKSHENENTQTRARIQKKLLRNKGDHLLYHIILYF